MAVKNDTDNDILLIGIATQIPYSLNPFKVWPSCAKILKPSERVLVWDNLGSMKFRTAVWNSGGDVAVDKLFLSKLYNRLLILCLVASLGMALADLFGGISSRLEIASDVMDIIELGPGEMALNKMMEGAINVSVSP